MPQGAAPRVRRFEVAERSMAPALAPGDYLVAVRGLPIRVGDVVVFPHPTRDRFWLVKRVTEMVDRGAIVLSDNRHVTRADSRSFGPVPVDVLYRVILRYWPLPRGALRFPRA